MLTSSGLLVPDISSPEASIVRFATPQGEYVADVSKGQAPAPRVPDSIRTAFVNFCDRHCYNWALLWDGWIGTWYAVDESGPLFYYAQGDPLRGLPLDSRFIPWLEARVTNSLDKLKQDIDGAIAAKDEAKEATWAEFSDGASETVVGAANSRRSHESAVRQVAEQTGELVQKVYGEEAGREQERVASAIVEARPTIVVGG